MVPLLELRNIWKNIQNEFFLEEINLDLYRGEVHILMGENGSGKSCIMQIVSGEIQPDKGQILFHGKKTEGSVKEREDLPGIEYISQSSTVIDTLSIAENIYYENLPVKNRLFQVIDRDRLRRQCADLIEELDLPFDLDDEVRNLGYAQRQIMGFCRAYISDAEIVILDEPSAALTPHDRIILHNILQKLKERDSAVFFISHNLEEIREIGDRISIIKSGRIVGTRQLALCSDQEIIQMMSGIQPSDPYPKLSVRRGEEILRVEDLQALDILNNISLELHKGEILGITGLAGSGRTFLARCLFGDYPRDRGKIFVRGKEISIAHPREAIEAGIALIPEDRFKEALFAHLAIGENVSVSSLHRFTHNALIDVSLLNRIVQEYLEGVNVENQGFNQQIKDYSIGNQQKAILTRWMLNRSKIYILDEITRCLDIPSRIDIYNSMNDLITKGAGILFISSDIEEILGMCDRILVLSDGEIVSELQREKTNREEILAYATGEKAPSYRLGR